MTKIQVRTNQERTGLEIVVGEMTQTLTLDPAQDQHTLTSKESISALLYTTELTEEGTGTLYVGTHQGRQGNLHHYHIKIEDQKLTLQKEKSVRPGFNVYDFLPAPEGVLVAGAGSQENGVRYITPIGTSVPIVETEVDENETTSKPVVFGFLEDPLSVQIGSAQAMPESIAASARYAGLDDEEIVELTENYQRKNVYQIAPELTETH